MHQETVVDPLQMWFNEAVFDCQLELLGASPDGFDPGGGGGLVHPVVRGHLSLGQEFQFQVVVVQSWRG